ncbi:toxin-antitoxin system TumE family protein [Lysinibacillus fusiformis]|uniref:toxin-antitoxin system TumE family protein n=1 Tax=Lysinibacillus fusiformis TaxID=28031 RepID=UPI003718FB75
MPSSSDYTPLITRFESILRQPTDLLIEDDPTNSDNKVIKITFYFISSFYGETRLRVREWYDKNDNKIQYRYSWEKNSKKPGHISAWENEHHEVPHHILPEGLKSDPHHHHHIPGDRVQVQDNWTIRNLESVLSIVEGFIIAGKPYDSKLL